MSWTRNGTRIAIRGRGVHEEPVPPVPPVPPSSTERVGPIESRWGSKGALCISHLRLWSAGSECTESSEAEVVKYIQDTCKLDPCDEATSCGTESAETDGATVWRTCTVNHVPHTKQEIPPR